MALAIVRINIWGQLLLSQASNQMLGTAAPSLGNIVLL